MTKKVLVFAYSILFLLYSNPVLSFGLNDKNSQNLKLSRPNEFLFQNYRNQELISIRLLGAVLKPGLYHVPKNISLITLLTLAGGPTKEADIENIRIGNDSKAFTRKKSVATFKQKNLTLNLNEAVTNGLDKKYSLEANDIVLVNNKKLLISNDTFRIVSIASVILSGVLTALLIDDRLKD